MINHEIKESDLALHSSLFAIKITDIVDKYWPAYADPYKKLFKQDFPQIEVHAKTELTLTSIYSYNQTSVGWDVLHKLYTTLVEKFHLVFTTNAERHLEEKISQGLIFGFEKVLINRNRGRKSPKKTPQSVIDYIVALYCDPRGYSKKQIEKMVGENLYLTVSYSTIKRYTNNDEVENLEDIDQRDEVVS